MLTWITKAAPRRLLPPSSSKNGIDQVAGGKSDTITSPVTTSAAGGTVTHHPGSSSASSSSSSKVTSSATNGDADPHTGSSSRSASTKVNPASKRLCLPLSRPSPGLGSQLPSPLLSCNSVKGSSSGSIACDQRSNSSRASKRSDRPAGLHVTEPKKKSIQQHPIRSNNNVCTPPVTAAVAANIRQQQQQQATPNPSHRNFSNISSLKCKQLEVKPGCRTTAATTNGTAKSNNCHPQTPASASTAAAVPSVTRKRQTVCPGSASVKSAASSSASSSSSLSVISLQKEAEKWKRTSDSYKKSLETTRVSMAQSLQAFDSFAVLIRYLTEQLSAFSNPILSLKLDLAMKRCHALEEGVKKREKEIRDLLSVKERREGDLMDEIDQWKRELDASSVRNKNEKENLLEMHELEMKLLQDKHEAELRMLSERERGFLSQVDEREKRLSDKNQEVSQLNDRIRELEGSLKQDKDKRTKALRDKLKLYEDEISSLKVVLELRDEKIRSQNVQVMQLEEMCQELPSAKQSICLLRQKLEQLEISMEKKTDQIKRLFAENQGLKCETESTIREKKRLSLRNEELEYVLSESFIASTPAAAASTARPSLIKSASLSQVAPSSASSSHINGRPHASTSSSLLKNKIPAEDSDLLPQGLVVNLFGVTSRACSEPQTPIQCLSEGASSETPVLLRRKKRPALIPFTPPQEVNESNESTTSAPEAGDMLSPSGVSRGAEGEEAGVGKDIQMMMAIVQEEEDREEQGEQAVHEEEQKDIRHRPDLEDKRSNSCSSSPSPSSPKYSSLPPPVFIAVHASPFPSNGLKDQANLVTSTPAPTSITKNENNDYDNEDEVVEEEEQEVEEEGEDRILLHSHEVEAESESGFHSHDARIENLMQQHQLQQTADNDDANPPHGSAGEGGGGHHKCNLQNNIQPFSECKQSTLTTKDKSWKSAQESPSPLSNQQAKEGGKEKNDVDHHLHDDNDDDGEDDDGDALSESLNPYPCVRINGSSEKKIRT